MIRTRFAFASLLAVSGVMLAACGSSGYSSGGSAAAPSSATTAARPAGFAWLHVQTTPAGWGALHVPSSPAVLSYPPSWRPGRSDPGTVTALTKNSAGQIVGYLNATPQQGAETLANWKRFRPSHNAGEGDRQIHMLGSATALQFRRGTGSCVIEDYTTSSGSRYREISCLVRGSRATTVVVGAAPPAQWARQGPAIERAVSSFIT